MSHPFVETQAALAVRDAIEWSAARRYPTLITGAPGTGKTSALLYYRQEFRAFYFEVDDSAKSPAGMTRKLAQTLDKQCTELWARFGGKSSYFELTGEIIKTLKEVGRARLMQRYQRKPVIFVDEQQRFEAPALRQFLYICEQAECGLVLAGNAEKLTKTRPGESGALAQIHSRIGLRVKLDAPTPADCQAIALAHNVEGLDAYKALANFCRRTNLRELVRLLEEAAPLADGRGIALPLIETAAIGLYGNASALSAPAPIH